MKAITVRQPYASLIAAGVKTIETRPRSTSYRGRIAIHAAASVPAAVRRSLRTGRREASGRPINEFEDVLGRYRLDGESRGVSRALPLGAVVASAVLTDCVPIEDLDGDIFECPTLDYGKVLYVRSTDDEYALVVDRHAVEPQLDVDVSDQLPYGDFSPGRWALLLDDVKPTTERCPWCWGDTDCPYCEGAKVEIGSDGEPVGECGGCDGSGYDPCPVCDVHGTCDPVPARGQQAVPWEWTPGGEARS